MIAPASSASPQDLWVRPLQFVPNLLLELGADPGAVFRRAGVDPDILYDPNNRLDFVEVGRLLVECVAATRCEYFGLLLGQSAGLEAPGIVRRMMPFMASVRLALYALRAHLHLHDRGGVMAITPLEGDLVELAYVVLRPATPGASQIADAALAILLQLLLDLGAASEPPVAATLARSRPRDLQPYRLYYRTSLTFNAPRFALIVRSQLLEQRPPRADAQSVAAIQAVIDSAEADQPHSLTLKVRDLVGAMLPAFAPTFESIAKSLALSPRTLQRRLADEGTTVTAIIDRTKAELARQLLVETRMPVHEIAQTLHYDRPGAFTRAYVGWTGVTPRAARLAQQQRDIDSTPL